MVNPPLPDFKYVEMYEATRRWIWLDTPSSTNLESARLTEIMQTIIPDNSWLSHTGLRDDVPIDQPADLGDGPAEIRFIDLSSVRHLLEFKTLSRLETAHRGKATFVVRHEYKLFIEHAMSLSLTDRVVFSFFVTGHPGIGKSVGAHYFLLCLLGSGKPVFWVQRGSVFYFNADGVQRLHGNIGNPATYKALKKSWVLMDVDQAEMPDDVYSISPFVIWTSSPHDGRIKYFYKTFLRPVQWFMKAWNTKEIAATADRLGSAHEDVLARMTWYGPVAWDLFLRGIPTPDHITSNIAAVFGGHPTTGTLPDCVFLVSPAVVEENGIRRLKRGAFSSEFLTPALAAKTFEYAEERLEKIQLFISHAFDFPSTQGLAGKMVEGLIHQVLIRGTNSFKHGIRLPAVLGGGAVAATLELIGNSDNFISRGDHTAERPLYLRPSLRSFEFAPVDAMVTTTPNQLGLLRTSLDTITREDFGTMFNIIDRLPAGAGVQVEDLEDVVYCLVGSKGTAYRVQTLVYEASAALSKLQQLAKDERLAEKFYEEVGVSTDAARARIRMFRVVGFTFDPQTGFEDATPSSY
ncbi:hypothetical protein B0H19DRAFT_218918 [Mycena capillaripes]|nr:hypothetical protein B0H19DRAFT_218918 [Mycena capillaripes]